VGVQPGGLDDAEVKIKGSALAGAGLLLWGPDQPGVGLRHRILLSVTRGIAAGSTQASTDVVVLEPDQELR